MPPRSGIYKSICHVTEGCKALELAEIGLGDAVVPGEVILVEQGPDEPEADGDEREHHGAETPAQLGTIGAVFVERAEGDSGVAHARGGGSERKEERVVEEPGEDEAAY